MKNPSNTGSSWRKALLGTAAAVALSMSPVVAQSTPFGDTGVTSAPSRSAGASTATKPGFKLPKIKWPEFGFSVPYTLEGIVTVQEDVVTLHTSDGRVFILMISAGRAEPFVGKTVRVEGMAKQADQLSRLKVKKIAAVDSTTKPVDAAPFKVHQTPPSLVSQDADSFVIRNVRWEWQQASDSKLLPVWETVTINPDLVENVYFVKKPFPPEWIAAHSFLAFTFRPGGMVDSKGRSANALVLTIEAYQRTDQNYDLKAGLKKTFAVSWILTTWKNYLEQSCKYGKEKLILYPTTFTDSQKADLVRETLEQATVDRSGEFYHTVLNNCTNNLIVLFNHVLPKEKQIKMWWVPSFIYNIRATMPVMVPKMLIKKGILEKELPEVNSGNQVADIETWRDSL